MELAVTHFLNPRLMLAALLLSATCGRADDTPPLAHPGAAIYTKVCADCHGKHGEGVKDEYDEPLVGDRSLAALTKRIARTMPDDDPGSLSPEDAAQVAAYIYGAFYSPAAQARLHPPEIDLARLTVPQFRTSIADLIAGFRGGFKGPPQGPHGLKGFYSGIDLNVPKPKPKDQDTGQVRKKEPVTFQQIDGQVMHSFGAESPNPCTMGGEQFSIRWEGSVFAEETGTYEFVLRTENGARLWVNNLNVKLIDGWVTAGPNVRDEKKSIFLLGGRSYPLLLEFFKYKDKSASIELLWKPPHGALQTVPERFLSPQQVPTTMVVSTNFPADDRSIGYERGTGVSKAWQQATLDAAIAVAEHVEQNLPELSGAKGDAPDRVDKLKEFSRRLMQSAFRRPLTPEHECFIEMQFDAAKTVETAVRRVVLFALKSPHFVYPDLHERTPPDSYDVASRLALMLWDSLPDRELLDAAAAGKLQSRDEIVSHARRMLHDQRTKTKLAGFFHHWLDLARAESIAKDPNAFPGFDEAMVADLRTSLMLFIDQVVWSESSDYRELLGADYLLLNHRLAEFYGKGDVRAGFQRVAFDPKERAGVITHPYLMSSLAHAKLTSPIHRGVFLTRNVLGLSLKSPAMAVVFEDSKFDPSLTMREKITELTRDTSCMGCHAVINPLGFALEQYDAVGRWRTEDNKKPVNASADLHTDEGETVRLNGARDIAELAARSETGQRAFIRHLFHHTVKQEPAAVGAETMNSLLRSFTASEFNIQKLLVEIVAAAASHRLPAADPTIAQK
jgi:mono/diheme cytochrome c family protein